MRFAEFKLGRFFLGRLAHDSEVIKSITNFASERKVGAGTFTLVGAVKRAKLAYYDQKKKDYVVIELRGPHEIASCLGNISLHRGKPFVHAHAVLADERGCTRAGHLLEAQVFAAELHLQELLGPGPERMPDKVTGLTLWKM